MNRVLRAGLFVPVVLFAVAAAAWLGSGGGGYGGSPEYYPVTVLMWLNDSFVGGVSPAAAHGTTEAAVLGMLAAGNDLIYVEPGAPRCPVMTVAWVNPDPGTPGNAQVYSATIRCAQSGNATYGQGDTQNGAVPDTSEGVMTFAELRRA